jgi:hypothetical protein
MKTSLKILSTVALIALIFVGCEKIKDATDIEFTSTFTTDLDCVVPAGSRGINGNFNSSAEIDLTSDPDVNKYLGKIKSFDILSVKVTFIDVSKDVTLTTTTLKIIIPIVDVPESDTISWTFINTELHPTPIVELEGNEPEKAISWDSLPADDYTIGVSTSGTSNQDNVTFKMEVAIKTKFVANPL